MPPPRTRSNSAMPVAIRFSLASGTSLIETGRTAGTDEGLEPDFFRSRVASSKNEFHVPQSGHFPSQRGDAYPQFWQTKCDFSFFIETKWNADTAPRCADDTDLHGQN